MPITEIDRATGLASSAAYKVPCLVTTTASIVLAAEQVIDGVLTAGSRVLVKNQTDPAENGIYISSSGFWQRAPDFSRNEQIREGTRVWVSDGTVGRGEYVVTSPDPIDLDTSPLTFALSTAAAVAAAEAAASAAASAASAAAALASENAGAADAAAAAADAATVAADKAIVAADKATVAADKAAAAASASAAATSAGNASSSAGAAASSAADAATSETNAGASEAAAAASAAAAAASAGSMTTVAQQINAATDEAFADDAMLTARKADGSLLKRSWANLKGAIWTALGGLIAGGTNKATLVAADKIAIADSAASNASKHATLANLSTFFKGLGGLTLAAGDILYASGVNTLAKLAKGTDGHVLTLAGGLPTWAVGMTPVDVQTFSASGTWTKPAGGTMALVRIWGGGGGGFRMSAGAFVGAGGGGAYEERLIPLSSFGATVTVVVGAGGVGRAGSTGDGTDGGNSSFGSYVAAGGGGGKIGTNNVGGAGGGLGGGSGANSAVSTVGSPARWAHGGGGGGLTGGDSYYGGGGGGTSQPGGVSVYGGNGGQGSGGAGSVPGGGGGGPTGTSQNGGNGARGQVEVYVF